jgi:hypothetical protein
MGKARGQGQSSVPPQKTASEDNRPSIRPTPAERYPRYLLRESDVLQITFRFIPEFDQTVTTQPDGFVHLLGVGDMHVTGSQLRN